MKLYDISERMIELFRQISDLGGEATEEQETELATLLEEEEDKVEAYQKVRATIKAQEEASLAESRRLLALSKSLTNSRNSLEGRLKHHLESTGTTKVTTSLGRVWLQKNPDKIEILDEEIFASKCPQFVEKVTINKIDRRALRDAIKNNDVGDLQGSAIKIEEPPKSLRFR